MERSCDQCGRTFAARSKTCRFCTRECRAAFNRVRERERQRTRRSSARPPAFVIQDAPLMRLRDVPPHVRFKAFRELVDSGALSEAEIPLAFAAALEPGHLSTRIAA